MAGKSNTDKKLTLHEESRTRRVNIKVNYEQLYRYVHGDVDIIINELKQAKDISNTLAEQVKTLSDTQRDELKKKKEAILKQKNVKLKAAIIQEGILSDFFNAVQNMDKDLYFVAAILHDKDVFVEDFWTTDTEDDHIHIVVIGTMQANGKRRRFIISDILDKLRIKFDKERDKGVIDWGAIQVCKHIEESVKYLTHSTEASEVDGKYPYDDDEVYTNDRKAYEAFTSSAYSSARTRLTAEKAVDYVPKFREAGLKLMSFRDAFRLAGFSDWVWYDCQGKNAVLNVFRVAYEEGLTETVVSNHVDRICLYIYGAHEIGKTTAVQRLCETLGITKDQIFIAADGYGKYDGLTPQHEVLLADDVSLQNMLTLADERVAKLSQRNKGYSVFSGSFVIVTSNVKPEDFFHKVKEDKHGNVLVDKNGVPRVSELYEARISRFAIIRANDDGTLTFERPITRGTRNNTAFEKKAIVEKLIKCMETSTREYCANISMSSDDILKYPSYEVAKLCKTSPDADFVAFVEAHLKDFGDNLDLYYEAYNDSSPILYEDDFTFEDNLT